MLSEALTVNFAHIAAVGHASVVSGRLHWGCVKASPCYLTLGRINDDHWGFDVVGKAGSSLFNLHSSWKLVFRVVRSVSVLFYERVLMRALHRLLSNS